MPSIKSRKLFSKKTKVKNIESSAISLVEKESSNISNELEKITSCYKSMVFTLHLLYDGITPISSLSLKKTVKTGLLACIGCGKKEIVPLSYDEIQIKLISVLDEKEKKLIAFEISPNHHFVIMKFESDKIAIFQSYQDVYSLNDWMKFYKNDKILKISDFFIHFKNLFDKDDQIKEATKIDSLKKLFMPIDFKNEESSEKILKKDFPDLSLLRLKNIDFYKLIEDVSLLTDEKRIMEFVEDFKKNNN